MRLVSIAVMMVALTWQASAVGASGSADIAYLRLTQNYWQVWVTDRNGQQHRQITFDPTDKARVSWNPDRSQLLCNSNDGTLQIVDVATQRSSRLALDSLGVYDAQWSPSGKQITYSATTSLQADNAEIWVTDINGGSKEKITNSLTVALTPAWNPKKGTVLYSAGKPGKNQELWEVNPSAGTSEQLTVSNSSALDPSVNTDGAIAYSSDATGHFNLWLMRVGHPVERITNSAAFDAQPSWSPDGKYIAFYRLDNNQRRIWIIDLKTREAHPITPVDAASRFPAWIR